jgi:hypothetical protein
MQMNKLSTIIVCVLLVIISCKKQASCPNIVGKWLSKSTVANGIETKIPDTSAISETLEITADFTFVTYSTKTNEQWNSGTFDCSKVFEADSASFKKGSKNYYVLYGKIR